jgi:ASC-1-like (ASCH) protein
MTHKLKTINPYYHDVLSGKKTFEVRRNDREYSIGDIIVLQEYDADTGKYSGRELSAWITYILDDERYVREGYIIIGIEVLEVRYV